MSRSLAIAIGLIALPGAVLAASKTYEVGHFEGVAVAAGIVADIKLGTPQSVVAETSGNNFDDLVVWVDGNVLRLGRPPGSWFMPIQPEYHVHITVPVLHSLAASSGGGVSVNGTPEGDFAAAASSGGGIQLSAVEGGNLSIAASSSGGVRLAAFSGGSVITHASSGGSVSVAGSCGSFSASASSGGDITAHDLKCESVVAEASSGGDISAFASKSITGHASSGGDIRVAGKPPVVQVSESSGGAVAVEK